MAETTSSTVPPASTPEERAAPIESRFLFVDVAAQRANQLRRGARVRLSSDGRPNHKLERAAMEEVKQRLVFYALPDLPSSRETTR